MNSPLFWSITLYLAITIGIGLYAAKRVHSDRDFVLAGRSLPLGIVMATVFATWFGAESILGTSANFTTWGLASMVGDPFAASLALVLVGVFYAKRLYAKNYLTIGSFYREKYGRTIEILASLATIGLYLAWTSAQIVALGLAFHLVLPWVSPIEGMWIGSSVVLIYTIFWGMWSVALTDFFQVIIILIGLSIIAYILTEQAGGAGRLFELARETNKFQFFPTEWSLAPWLAFLAPWIALSFGSIPQQDIYQRVMSAKDATTASWGSTLGGIGYFIFAFVPAYIAFSSNIIDPTLLATTTSEGGDPQLLLPGLIMAHTPLWVQALFFGALLSAIMSTASGATLAPANLFSENIIKPFLGELSRKKSLLLNRLMVGLMSGLALLIALNSNASISRLVELAGSITAVTVFVPLTLGLFWSKARPLWALLSILLGGASCLILQVTHPDGIYPPVVVGFMVSLIAMVIGSYMEKYITKGVKRDQSVLL
jgi:solute:Na+ symporter, SSS family